jgi:hypothetical protein
MTAYYYNEGGKVKQINLNPTEYIRESAKHKLYHSRKEAKKGAKAR